MNPLRRRGPRYGVLLLLYQIFGAVGIDNIPPITLSLIGLQVAIFLRLFKVPWLTLSNVCISFYKVFYKQEYRRLLFSSFEHVDDWHLYFNMVSFILKGQSLERRFGSLKFLYITAVFTVLTNVMYLILGALAGKIDEDYETQCAVGFSGVLFALKVLTTFYEPNHSHQIMGIPVLLPARYAVWAEIVLIQILVPNVSFLGHLGGALIGLLYISGPLKLVMDFVYSVISLILQPRFPLARERPHRFEPHVGPTGHRLNSQFSNYIPPGMSEEEQLQRATEASLRYNFQPRQFASAPYPPPTSENEPNPPPTSENEPNPPPTLENELNPPPLGLTPDLSEMRRRRLEHFHV